MTTDRLIHGGCQCGNVRFTLPDKPYAVYACHCAECKKQTASSFALSMPVKRADCAVTGPIEVYTRRAFSGTTTDCVFCPNCGSRLYHRSASSRELLTIKMGALDEAVAKRPVAHLWVCRKDAWLVLADDALIFQTQPDDLAAWRDDLINRVDGIDN